MILKKTFCLQYTLTKIRELGEGCHLSKQHLLKQLPGGLQTPWEQRFPEMVTQPTCKSQCLCYFSYVHIFNTF